MTQERDRALVRAGYSAKVIGEDYVDATIRAVDRALDDAARVKAVLAALEATPKPVCSTCNDTHRMTFNPSWFCTSCPVPCETCRQPQGAFCQTTPCACACHTKAGT